MILLVKQNWVSLKFVKMQMLEVANDLHWAPAYCEISTCCKGRLLGNIITNQLTELMNHYAWRLLDDKG